MPSWVPDCRHEIDGPFPLTTHTDDPSSEALSKASGKYFCDVSKQNSAYSNDTRLLLLSGLRISDLEVLKKPLGEGYDIWEYGKRWQPVNGDRDMLSDWSLNA